MECDHDPYATKKDSDLESKAANPVKGEGRTPREQGNMRLLEGEESDDKENNPEDGGEEGKGGEEDNGDDDEGGDDDEDEGPQCVDGKITIEKSPAGFEGKDNEGNEKIYVKVQHNDVVFMRMGFFHHLKLNTDSMIKEFSQDTWMTVDMLLDWDAQTVSIYIDGVGIKAVPFFAKRSPKVTHVNTLAIYGLTPGSISRFRNLQICEDELCASGE